jgi:hypothetical protein
MRFSLSLVAAFAVASFALVGCTADATDNNPPSNNDEIKQATGIGDDAKSRADRRTETRASDTPFDQAKLSPKKIVTDEPDSRLPDVAAKLREDEIILKVGKFNPTQDAVGSVDDRDPNRD